jgi:uncharacterized protein
MPSKTNGSVYIEGYASVFNYPDQSNDIVLKGAFARSIQDKFSPIKLLWQHDVNLPIGNIVTIKEDEHGLFIKAGLVQSTQAGREAIELIRLQVVSGLSVGIVPRRSMLNRNGYNEISEAVLHEVSVVTFPANLQARIKSIYEDKADLSELIHSANNLKSTLQQLIR